jgi:molybdopterin-synthase adenylyltransferase
METNLFARIAPLFDVGVMASARVFIAGCGSGGSSVALHLAMAGIVDFTLADHDTLEPENVIRHVCGLRYVGQRKVEAVADVLRDRNPKINVTTLDTDILRYDRIDDEVASSTVVVLATDNEPSRYRINEICVRTQTPFVVGRVFTRGTGGEVFAFRPGSGGCLACLEGVLERSRFREGVREIDLLTEKEREAMYGLERAEIKDSPGLNVDIAFITAFHTRFVLDAIARRLTERPKHLSPLAENYLVWGNRPVHPFTKNFELQRLTLQPQEGCRVCGE